MNIDKTQNVNFKGTVHLLDGVNSQNPVIRPLIHQLKHHCGSDKVVHYVAYYPLGSASKAHCADVTSVYVPKNPINGVDQFKQQIRLVVLGSEIERKELYNWKKDTKEWFQRIRNGERFLEKQKKLQELANNSSKKNSFWEDFFQFLSSF